MLPHTALPTTARTASIACDSHRDSRDRQAVRDSAGRNSDDRDTAGRTASGTGRDDAGRSGIADSPLARAELDPHHSHIANVPPAEYLSLYPNAVNHASPSDFASLLYSASKFPRARCPHTGIEVQTSLNARAWADHFLASHYPHHHAAVVLTGAINTGVRLAFSGKRSGFQSGDNLVSASEHTDAVHANMLKECSAGRRRGPLDRSPFPFFYSNPLGVVFKKGGTKPRIIHHLSYPRDGDSVNAHVAKLEVQMHALERAIANLKACGRGTHMAKVDIESAYRCIPVSPEDWPLQGMRWGGSLFFDIVMQFGLSSATAIFEYYSSATEYFAKVLLRIAHLEHYVDDFFLMASSHSLCLGQMNALLRMFTELGWPFADEKNEGPSTALTFLGIKFDSVAMTLSLDSKKLEALRQTLDLWAARTKGSRQELQSLCGLLNFASVVVRSGRAFFRRILDQLKAIPSWSSAGTQYPLSDDFFADIKWWRTFVVDGGWNGVSILPLASDSAPTVTIHTDACGQGYGALTEHEWLRGDWSAEELECARRADSISMPWLEFRAIVIAASTWGARWRGQHVHVMSDCQPAIDAWKKETSADRGLADLIRTLLFLCAQHDFSLTMQHIPGIHNTFADWLSRGQVTLFLASATTHSRSPTIPSPPPIQTW